MTGEASGAAPLRARQRRPRDAEGALSHPSPASRPAGRMRGSGGGVVNGAAVRAEFTSREEVGGEGAGWGRERAAAAAAASSSGGGCGCSACAAGGGGTGGGKGGRRRRGLTKGEASAGAGTARGGREGGREGRRAAGGGGPTTMPRVVPDQRSKFENEEFFRKLSRECEVRRRWRRGSPLLSLPPSARRRESFRGPRRGRGSPAPPLSCGGSRAGGAGRRSQCTPLPPYRRDWPLLIARPVPRRLNTPASGTGRTRRGRPVSRTPAATAAPRS